MRTGPHRSRGLTLIELMIVLAVVAILAAVAWPTFDGVVTEQRRSDAVRALLQAQVDMERCQARQGSYAGCAPDDAQSPNGDYDIGVNVDDDGAGYTLIAAPTDGGNQAGDADLSLDHLGRRGGPWPD